MTVSCLAPAARIQRVKGGEFLPLLWHHNIDQPLGRITWLEVRDCIFLFRCQGAPIAMPGAFRIRSCNDAPVVVRCRRGKRHSAAA